MNILILSPHRDDAALSLALAIEGWLATGHRVTVLGVFTRSLNAPFSDADTVHPNDLLSYVSAMRRREDAEFLKLMPALRMVDLNLKDAPLRLRCSVDDLYTLGSSADDTAIAKIQKALARLAAEQPIDAVLLPLALGHHVDHLVVRNSALAFANVHACAFYEDLPDALLSANDIDASALAEFDALRTCGLFTEVGTPIILPAREDTADSVRAKRRFVSVYNSQLDEITIDAIGNLAAHYAGGGERVWVNAAWFTSGI